MLVAPLLVAAACGGDGGREADVGASGAARSESVAVIQQADERAGASALVASEAGDTARGTASGDLPDDHREYGQRWHQALEALPEDHDLRDVSGIFEINFDEPELVREHAANMFGFYYYVGDGAVTLGLVENEGRLLAVVLASSTLDDTTKREDRERWVAALGINLLILHPQLGADPSSLTRLLLSEGTVRTDVDGIAHESSLMRDALEYSALLWPLD